MFIPHQQKHIQFSLIRFTNTENEAEFRPPNICFSLRADLKLIYTKVQIHVHFS